MQPPRLHVLISLLPTIPQLSPKDPNLQLMSLQLPPEKRINLCARIQLSHETRLADKGKRRVGVLPYPTGKATTVAGKGQRRILPIPYPVGRIPVVSLFHIEGFVQNYRYLGKPRKPEPEPNISGTWIVKLVEL